MSGGHTEPWQLRGDIVYPKCLATFNVPCQARGPLCPARRGRKKKAERRKFWLEEAGGNATSLYWNLPSDFLQNHGFRYGGCRHSSDLRNIWSVKVTLSNATTPLDLFGFVPGGRKPKIKRLHRPCFCGFQTFFRMWKVKKLNASFKVQYGRVHHLGNLNSKQIGGRMLLA